MVNVFTPSFGRGVRKLHPFENKIIIVYYNIIISKMSVKNINSLRYFLDRWEMVDPEYNYTVPYHDSVDPPFSCYKGKQDDYRIHMAINT